MDIVKSFGKYFSFATIILGICIPLRAQYQPTVPKSKRGSIDAERSGMHDANSIRTVFKNYGMVGDYPDEPLKVDLTVFHSVEVPKGTGMNYSDGITPFVLAKVYQSTGLAAYIMETGYRERQQVKPGNIQMRFEPRPGYLEPDPTINTTRSIAMSHDSRTWPARWPDKESDSFDPGWPGSWNGYFGKRPAADQESFFVMDDDAYDAWFFNPDSRDSTRRGLALRVEVRGFQWSNPQARNVIFWHYDIVNEGTTNYDDNIIFGLYMDSGVGGSALSCDGIAESDDDNAYFDRSSGLNLTYTWDKFGHGVDLRGLCSPTGYLGYAYLETPGNPYDGIDNDDDGITDERRDSGEGVLIEGQDVIRAYVASHYTMSKFESKYGKLENRPAYKVGRWWTGDEDMDWIAELCDVGGDGVAQTNDPGESDGKPSAGEPNFDQTDLDESDQIGLTGFKMNRIRGNNPSDPKDDIVFFMGTDEWPRRLYDQFTNPSISKRFDSAVVLNYNIGFLFASGPFKLMAGKRERFSLALGYGADLDELRTTVKVVQQIYNANYQFAVPPPLPTVTAEVGDKIVRLSWDDVAERGIDPVTFELDYEGYKVYRATDAAFLDPQVITNARGTGTIGNGKSLAIFDLKNGIKGFSQQIVDGVAYDLGTDSGIRHSFIDTNVVNGQTYYYAVCAYDHGDTRPEYDFYPSENPIIIHRTPRGGTMLSKNVVEVTPNPRVAGYTPAKALSLTHTSGKGTADISIQVVNSKLVPNNANYQLKFFTDSQDTVRANRYELVNINSGKRVIQFGSDLAGSGTGPVGDGLLPVINTPSAPYVDQKLSGFTSTSQTNVHLKVSYVSVVSSNIRRPAYPEDLKIIFADTPLDTTLSAIGLPSKPVKFKVIAIAETAEVKLKTRFYDIDKDSTLSSPDEYIDVITYLRTSPTTPRQTWRIELDTSGQYMRGVIQPPRAGDVYLAKIVRPVSEGDIYTFVTDAEKIDPLLAKDEYKKGPYVVPNPYVGAASFEPERFAVSGRGERRIEFRGLPMKAVVRIYTVRGDLVRTLYHNGSNDGAVAWDLRTKDNLEVAPGLYIFHVEASGFDSFIGKFAIIK